MTTIFHDRNCDRFCDLGSKTSRIAAASGARCGWQFVTTLWGYPLSFAVFDAKVVGAEPGKKRRDFFSKVTREFS